MGSYRDLVAWKKAMRLALHVYQETKGFPREEVYGLTSQLRRAAVSVIAEGQARFSQKEFRHFLNTAKGFLAELDTQLLLARELKLLQSDTAAHLLQEIAEVGRLVSGLQNSMRERTHNLVLGTRFF